MSLTDAHRRVLLEATAAAKVAAGRSTAWREELEAARTELEAQLADPLYAELAGAFYCPDCGNPLDDWRGHGSECRFREVDTPEEPEVDTPGSAGDDDAGDGGCPEDPDGLHHAGCGCDDVDPINPN